MPEFKLPNLSSLPFGDKLNIVSGGSRADLFQKIVSFIPGKISNKTVIDAFELMRKQQKMSGKSYDNQADNKRAFAAHKPVIERNKGYVEDQSTYTDLKYGKSTVQAAGCEIIATYNALFNIHGKQLFDLSELVSIFEKDGMIFDGHFGTSPRAAVDFLTGKGYHAELETEEKNFDTLGKKCHSFILTMYNDANDISQEVHTINISKDRAGKFTAHNTYCNGQVLGPFASVSETIANINSGKAKGISLIGISPTEKTGGGIETQKPEPVKPTATAPKPTPTAPKPVVQAAKPTQTASKPTSATTAKPNTVANKPTATAPSAKPATTHTTASKPNPAPAVNKPVTASKPAAVTSASSGTHVGTLPGKTSAKEAAKTGGAAKPVQKKSTK